jgi:hypothetical protein
LSSMFEPRVLAIYAGKAGRVRVEIAPESESPPGVAMRRNRGCPEITGEDAPYCQM